MATKIQNILLPVKELYGPHMLPVGPHMLPVGPHMLPIDVQAFEVKCLFSPELIELIEQDRRYALFDEKFRVILTLLGGGRALFRAVDLAGETGAANTGQSSRARNMTTLAQEVGMSLVGLNKALELKVSIQPKARADGWRRDC